MKKHILSLIAVTLLFSCSSDDDSTPVAVEPPAPTSFLKVTIGGTEYNYNKFVIETETVVDGPDSYVDLHVIANIVGDESKAIVFNLEQDVAGPDSIYFFYLLNAGGEFDNDHASATLVTNLTKNSNRNIVGTFSGTLSNFDDTETVQMTNGSFNITY